MELLTSQLESQAIVVNEENNMKERNQTFEEKGKVLWGNAARQVSERDTKIVDVKDNKMRTPLYLAAKHNHSQVTKS